MILMVDFCCGDAKYNFHPLDLTNVSKHPIPRIFVFFPGKSRIPTSALHKFQRSEFRPLLTTTLTEISERKQLQKKSPHCFWTKNSSMAKSLNPNCVSRKTNQTIKESINQFKLRHFTAQGRVFFSNEGMVNFLPATFFVVAFLGFFHGRWEGFCYLSISHIISSIRPMLVPLGWYPQ